MDLELSDGTVIEGVGRQELESKIDMLGNGTDHLILSDDDAFIQAAGGPVEMFVQYNTGQGMMESSSNIDSGTVKKIFTAFLEGDPGWKQLIPFQPMDDGPIPANGTPGGRGVSGGAAQAMGTGSPLPNINSLKKSLVNSVKTETGNSLGYMIRRAIRKFFRRIF